MLHSNIAFTVTTVIQAVNIASILQPLHCNLLLTKAESSPGPLLVGHEAERETDAADAA